MAINAIIRFDTQIVYEEFSMAVKVQITYCAV
jgi:hypothetical protein